MCRLHAHFVSYLRHKAIKIPFEEPSIPANGIFLLSDTARNAVRLVRYQSRPLTVKPMAPLFETNNRHASTTSDATVEGRV